MTSSILSTRKSSRHLGGRWWRSEPAYLERRLHYTRDRRRLGAGPSSTYRSICLCGPTAWVAGSKPPCVTGSKPRYLLQNSYDTGGTKPLFLRFSAVTAPAE